MYGALRVLARVAALAACAGVAAPVGAIACPRSNPKFFFNYGSAAISLAPDLKRHFPEMLIPMPSDCVALVAAVHIDGAEAKAGFPDLASARGASVRRFLSAQGVPTASFALTRVGPAKPLVYERPEEGDATSRRVEIVRWLAPHVRIETVGPKPGAGACHSGCCPTRATLPDGTLCFGETR